MIANPEEGAALLSRAAEAWTGLDRPLEAARSRLLAGQVVVRVEPERGRELLEEAAQEIGEALGMSLLYSSSTGIVSPSPAVLLLKNSRDSQINLVRTNLSFGP